MRKNRFLILIALVLVCALLAITVVGCQKAENPVDNTPVADPDKDTDANTGGGFQEDENGNTSEGGETFTINNADPYITFDVKADSASDISVTNAVGNAVAVDIKESNGVFTVWAPNGGYEKNRTFRITLSNGATFVNYDAKISVISFTIANNAYDIELNSGYLTYSEKAIVNAGEESTDAMGVTRGYMVLQTNSDVALAVDSIFIIEKADGTQAAYKVEKASTGGVQKGCCLINYVKPDLSEVFAEFDYSGTTKLTKDSNVEFDYKGGVEALTNSELAMSIFSMFGSAPEFSIDVPEFDADGHIVIDVTITIPNVVQLEGYASAGLVIKVRNVMDVEASANIDKESITEEFALGAKVLNDITTTVSIDSDGGYTGAVNIPELMDKLVELANDSEDSATAIPLFKWTVPIANGVASITYNADLMFRFTVAGDVNAEAHANLDYEVGVKYTKAYGIEAYAQELENNGFDSVNVNLGGKAELKIGLRQDLGFDILSGVLGIGIEAEIGNYNRLYGYGESSNLIDDSDDYFVGGVYFEGGFYYDVNLSYGIKIGSLLNLSDKADIVDGEIKGYEAGNRYLVLGVEATQDKYTLKALNTEIPAIYVKNMYDLVTGERFDVVAAAEEFTYVSDNSLLKIENNVIKVENDVNDVTVTATYVADTDLSVNVKYSFSMADPVLEKDTILVDKNAYDKINATIQFVVNYNGFANSATTVESDDFTLSVIERTKNSAKVSVPVKELLKLDNGMNELNMTIDGKALVLNLDVTGSVKWDQFSSASGYSVFTADQIVDMVKSNVTFEGNVVTIIDDIDMKGAEIAPIADFRGTLQGNGKTISNYTVNSFYGEKAGFVAVNNGKIDNIVFAGNVDVALEAYTGKDYAVAGIAGVNNGTISNCAFTGNVNVYSYGLAAFVEFDVAGITAVNSGTLTDNTGATGETLNSVNVTVKFDLANVKVRVGDTTSTTKTLDNVVVTASCENCVSGGPYATSVSIAK